MESQRNIQPPATLLIRTGQFSHLRLIREFMISTDPIQQIQLQIQTRGIFNVRLCEGMVFLLVLHQHFEIGICIEEQRFFELRLKKHNVRKTTRVL